MKHIFRRFRRDITGLMWLSIGIFLGLALLSYNPLDPSFNSIGNNLHVTNFCGYFGSFMADCFYQFFGLTAWVFVFSCIKMAWSKFRGQQDVIDHLKVIWCLLLLVTLSSLGTLYFPKVQLFASQISLGGFVGQMVSGSLVRVFNFTGVGVILWTLTAILLIFYTERSLVELLVAPFYYVKKMLSGLSSSIGTIRLSPVWATCQNYFSSPLVDYDEYEEKSSLQVSRSLLPEKLNLKLQKTGQNLKGHFFKITQEDVIEGSAGIDEVNETQHKFPIMKEKSEVKKSFKMLRNNSNKKRKVTLLKNIQRKIANWELPKISLLEDPPMSRERVDEKEVRQKAKVLVNKLEQFNVRGEVVDFNTGPAVTLFEFKPEADVKISKITELADDLSLALSSESVRIIAPIPGRDVVGIETSNSVRETVYLKDILADEEFWDEEIALPVALGQQADGKSKIVDLRKMPHLMIAGSTGSGKSVFTVSMIAGMIFRHSPKTLKMILVDPKQVDLATFNEIPHLLMPPVREAKKAIGALKWAIKEMEKRYRSMSKFGARGIESFNDIVEDLSKEEQEAFAVENEEGKPNESFYYSHQPYILIVVEEFGDLMAVDKSNVEQAVVRLAQMARACGIHLVLAMQSPRKDVVTGLIKTNIPGRIAFKVASKMDSRIVLDESGAERLLTRGDMLFLAPGVSKPVRHHGPWLTEKEIASVTRYWREQGAPDYDPLAMKALEGNGGGFDLRGDDDFDSEEPEFDERYDEILEWVSSMKEVSASLLQRKFRLGYPRAARIIEIFESQGVIGPSNGSKPRQVLVNELK